MIVSESYRVWQERYGMFTRKQHEDPNRDWLGLALKVALFASVVILVLIVWLALSPAQAQHKPGEVVPLPEPRPHVEQSNTRKNIRKPRRRVAPPARG